MAAELLASAAPVVAGGAAWLVARRRRRGTRCCSVAVGCQLVRPESAFCSTAFRGSFSCCSNRCCPSCLPLMRPAVSSLGNAATAKMFRWVASFICRHSSTRTAEDHVASVRTNQLVQSAEDTSRVVYVTPGILPTKPFPFPPWRCSRQHPRPGKSNTHKTAGGPRLSAVLACLPSEGDLGPLRVP